MACDGLYPVGPIRVAIADLGGLASAPPFRAVEAS